MPDPPPVQNSTFPSKILSLKMLVEGTEEDIMMVSGMEDELTDLFI